jgi:hypothetical protein
MAYGAYQVFIVGSPENVKFRNECWDSEGRKGLSDTQIAVTCERNLREHLGLKP